MFTAIQVDLLLRKCHANLIRRQLCTSSIHGHSSHIQYADLISSHPQRARATFRFVRPPPGRCWRHASHMQLSYAVWIRNHSQKTRVALEYELHFALESRAIHVSAPWKPYACTVYVRQISPRVYLQDLRANIIHRLCAGAPACAGAKTSHNIFSRMLNY